MKYNLSLPQRLLNTLAIVAFGIFTSATLHADVLAQFDMETNGSRDVASTVIAGIDVSNLVGNNLNSPTSLILNGADNVDDYIAWSRSSGVTRTDALGAIADGTYFNFTLTPDAGKSFSIDSISFDAFAGTGGPSDRQFYLLGSKEEYFSGNVLASASTVSGSPLIPYNSATADQNFSADLSGNSLYQNVTESVTFRIYIATPNTFQNLAFDDITVNGSVGSVIPEPSTYAFLGGLCALAAVSIRRRR